MMMGLRLPCLAFSLAVAVTVALPAGAAAQSRLPALAQDARVQAEFLAGAVGEEIANQCGAISPRMFVVLRRLGALEAHARRLGYTNEDFRALRRSEAARAELRQRRNAYLAAKGAVPGQPESYCRVGREEIRNGTLIGSLLRAG